MALKSRLATAGFTHEARVNAEVRSSEGTSGMVTELFVPLKERAVPNLPVE